MQRQTGVKVLVSLALAACAWAGVILAQSALAGLGVSDVTGRQIVDEGLRSGYVNVSSAAKAFKTAAPASRATLVKNALSWAKAYTESPAFKAEYEKQRQADTPTPPRVDGTVDGELARQRAERQKNIDEMKKGLAQMTPEMRTSMEATLKEVEAANKKSDTDPKMMAMFRQMVELQRADEQEAYQKRLEAHEQRFPPNPKTVIARRLQEFLDMSKDVDFDAKLVPAGSRMRFADPRYEENPPTWKLCFRAGREAVAAAREVAQAWLKSL
jgi:hypothetical protein